jgi:hypothetical protein
MVFTVLIDIVLCPFSHILVAIGTSFYVLVQDVSIQNLSNYLEEVRSEVVNSTANEIADQVESTYKSLTEQIQKV